MAENQAFVSILMGSDSDLPVMQASIDILTEFKVPFQAKVSSAHRTPMQTKEFVKQAEDQGCAVFICAAGLAAHLAGTVAALTTKPVIGVPLDAALGGLDSLLSTVQMPGGIPVASVAIGRAGATNAGILAVQILALSDKRLAQTLKESRESMVEKVLAKDAALQNKLAQAPAC